MGILDFTVGAGNAPAQSSVRNVGAANRPKAKLWLNIGYMKNGKFVNLPMGLPLDTMEPAKVSGQNQDWNNFQTARNELLKALQNIQLEPGASTEFTSLTIEVRHIADTVVVDRETNEYATDLSEMFAPNSTDKQEAAE